jgi:hypothetical protein
MVLVTVFNKANKTAPTALDGSGICNFCYCVGSLTSLIFSLMGGDYVT